MVMPDEVDIAVVGAGAAATLLASALRRCPGGDDLAVTVIGTGHPPGRGVAYNTPDATHRMNVPARRLSVDADGSDHLSRWLGVDAEDHVARSDYGAYLAAQLTASGASIVEGRVEALHPTAGGWSAAIDGAPALTARHVVLATGPPPGPGPVDLPDDRRVIADPWTSDLAARVTGRRVVVLGTGLTMVDVALTACAAGASVVAVSRHGALPRAHPPVRRRGARPFPVPDAPLRAADVRRLVVEHCRAEPAGWEAGMDAARDHADALWSRLPEDEQAKLLRRGLSQWTVHRHRMAPSVAAALDGLVAAGRVRVERGTVRSVQVGGVGVEVVGRSGRDERRWRGDVAVACTGPSSDVTRTTDPLLRALLSSGTAAPGPHRLGLAVDPCGQVVGAPGLWTLGPLRRGVVFETTAIPEIRRQAAALAVELGASLLRPGARDLSGARRP